MTCKDYCNKFAAGLCAAAILSSPLASRAATIAGPYTADANTLHLWHMDTSVPIVDAGASPNNLVKLANGATLNNASLAGFTSALSTLDGGQNGISVTSLDAYLTASSATPPGNVSITLADPTTTAFTMEAIVQIGFDPTKNLGGTGAGGNGRANVCEIMTGESINNANRVFQFRVNPIQTATGTVNLEFNNLNLGTAQLMSFPVPTTGADAILSNSWYHVAVTYNGTPGAANNVNFYWTLMDGTRTNADLLGSTSMTHSLPVAQTIFGVGNILGRTATNANFLGLIDEIRISGIARNSNDMMFSGAAPFIPAAFQPTNQSVSIGQSASFGAKALGLDPLSYQWQVNSTNIPGATATSFSLPSVQLSDGGPYDVVVTNGSGSVTSSVVTLTVRPPSNLTWLGLATANWNTADINWTNASGTQVAYSVGDNVTFDNNGAAVPAVNLDAPVSPSSVVVAANNNYTLSSIAGAGITGSSQLTQNGPGTLVLDIDNSYIGPTTIQGGILQLGAGDAHGTLGQGAITNNAAIVLDRTGTVSFTNTLTGTGTITNQLVGSVLAISASNTLSGPIVLNAGTLSLIGQQAVGNSPNITLNAVVNSLVGTELSLSSGVTIGGGTTLSLVGTSSSPDMRCTVTVGGDNSINALNCPVVLGGSGSIQFLTAGAGELDLDSSISQPGFTGKLVLRGTTGLGQIYGTISVPNANIVSKTDPGTWVIHSTGNSWTNSNIAAGTIRLAANNALPIGTVLALNSGGILDLGGFNQQIAGLSDTNNPSTDIIGNSSTNSDSVLTVNSAAPWTNYCVIEDSVSGGTRKVGLTVTGGGTLTLKGNNTYTGDTTVSAGTLALAGAGALNSTNGSIILTAGTIFDVSGVTSPPYHLRTDKTFSCGGVSGGATVNGALTENGGGFLSLTYVSGTPALNVTGGTLTLSSCPTTVIVSGSPLGVGTYTLISAGAGGAVAGATPAAVTVAGSGLAAGTAASLAITGGQLMMNVVQATPPSITSTSLNGTSFIFSGSNGTAGKTYNVLTSTNVTTPRTNWTPVFTNVFDVNGAFSVTNVVSPGTPALFFMLQVPPQ